VVHVDSLNLRKVKGRGVKNLCIDRALPLRKAYGQTIFSRTLDRAGPISLARAAAS